MSKHNKKDWNEFKEKNQAEVDEILSESSPFNEEISPQENSLEHPSYVQLSEQLTLSEQKAFENEERAVRAQAELDNFRRRAEREIANAHKYGTEKLITAILPVVDSLEQALQLAMKEEDVAMCEGLELTMKLFVDVLEKFDVQQIDPIGIAFDPQQHEAMSIQEVPGTEPNRVLAVFQKGYKLNDRIIRPARVIVSKK